MKPSVLVQLVVVVGIVAGVLTGHVDPTALVGILPAVLPPVQEGLSR